MELSEKDLCALELWNIYHSHDIERLRLILYDFLDLIIYIHEVLAEKKIAVGQNDGMSEELVIKFYLHGRTIGHISEAYKILPKYFKSENFSRVKFIDISSLLTVGRAQLETLLMYQHLYVNPENKSEELLRYYSWIYTALLQRKNTPTNGNKQKAQLEKDKIQMESLRVKMKELEAFQLLSERQKESIFEVGTAKLFKKWNDIFKESKFSDSKIFEKLYYILSAYSHSEGLSAIQLKTAKYFTTSKENRDMTFLQLFCSTMMSAVMIENIIRRFPEVKARFEQLESKVQHQVKLLSYTATGREPNA